MRHYRELCNLSDASFSASYSARYYRCQKKEPLNVYKPNAIPTFVYNSYSDQWCNSIEWYVCVPGALFIHLILIRANLMRLKLLPLFCSTEYSTSTTKKHHQLVDLIRTHQELQAKKYRYSVHHHGIIIFTQRHKTSASAWNNVLNGRLMLRTFFAI